MNDVFKGQLRQVIHHWNVGDIGMLLSWFSDDIAYCSPLIERDVGSGSSWVQGRQEVAQHLISIRKKLEQIELVEVLYGAGFVNLLLQHAGGLLSMNIEYNANKQARRVIVCHSSQTLDTATG